MKIELSFTRPGFIADPYRVQMFRLIEIQKQSGMMRARSEKKRRECLEAQLHDIGMTLEEFKQLEVEAREPFYHNTDGAIIIPSANVFSCLVNANHEAPSKMRVNNLRNALVISDFTTTKSEPDGVWERFTVVKSGSGAVLSNQRSLRTNPYICDFEATGIIEVDEQMVDPNAVLKLLEFAGRVVGIGASRKMGYGRFTVEAE